MFEFGFVQKKKKCLERGERYNVIILATDTACKRIAFIMGHKVWMEEGQRSLFDYVLWQP